MIGIGFTALGTNVEAATYYGNGLYCNKQKCWVDWNKASREIGKIIVNGWVQHGPWAPR
ncbi:class II bacteriocin [Enterococcus faecalis]|nr:class II bacteriocin [Enterococcus faecalis]